MTADIPTHSLSLGDDGALVNGRPALSIEDVQGWCRAASTPSLGEAAAAEIARELNQVAFLHAHWAPEFASLR